ncbi:MAG: Ig-like domain-containing protein, partial [Prevotella sp.]|nr:Ig-like domain-containing protein [Prevotella sp.]
IDTNIIEMWDYQHHRADRRVVIAPAIKDIVIDMVTINGETVVPTNDIYYYYTPNNNDTDNLDVVIDYTLHGRQTMTTHYDKDFNASLPDTDFLLVKEIILSSNSITLYPGKKSQISANVLPKNAENKTLIWTTSDESIATVNADGKVTAIAVGEATITATAADGSGVSATCQVTVKPIMVETLTINPETWSGAEGESFQITAVVTPEDATDKTVAWSSSDETVATVDATGYVNVLKGGSCVITASTQDGSGLSAKCIITSVSGIDDIFTDADARFDVYNLQGILVKKDYGRDDLKQLPTGAYILHQGNVNKKIIIQ